MDAVAEYVHSFTFVLVTETEGEFFKDYFDFSVRELVLSGDVTRLRGILFAPSAVLSDQITNQIWDQQLFFFTFNINSKPTRTSDIYTISLKELF